MNHCKALCPLAGAERGRNSLSPAFYADTTNIYKIIIFQLYLYQWVTGHFPAHMQPAFSHMPGGKERKGNRNVFAELLIIG